MNCQQSARLPKSRELYRFSATYGEDVNVDFRYPMGKAIEDGALCDYDITVPVAGLEVALAWDSATCFEAFRVAMLQCSNFQHLTSISLGASETRSPSLIAFSRLILLMDMSGPWSQSCCRQNCHC